MLFGTANAVEPLKNGDFFGKTVNIFTMNNLQGSSESGFGKDIWKMTYNSKCVKYGTLLPDTICSDFNPAESVSNTNGALFSNSSSNYQIAASKDSSFDFDVGIDGLFIPVLDLSLTASEQFGFAASFYEQHAAMVIISRATCVSYQATMSTSILPEKDPEFNSSIYWLMDNHLEYDPEVYVNWIKEYGTHTIRTLVMGAVYTGTSFFTDYSYNAMISEGIDVKVAASGSTWFAAIKGSVEVTESAEAQKYDKYASGIQTFSSRGVIPFSNDLSAWQDKSRQNPAPIRMELDIITDQLNVANFNDSRINIVRKNVAQGILAFCNVTKSCYKESDPQPVATVSDEYVLQGVGFHKTVMTPTASTICYFTMVRDLFLGGEQCFITREYSQPGDDKEFYYLSQQGGDQETDQLCGARCVANIQQPVFFQDFLIVGKTTSQTLLPCSKGFCVVTKLISVGMNNMCRLELQGDNNIVMVTTQSSGQLECGATCYTWNNVSSPSLSSFSLWGKYTQGGEKVMESADTHYCYITTAKTIYRGGERCQILKKLVNGKTGEYWVLSVGSGQDGFGCEATCLSFV